MHTNYLTKCSNEMLSHGIMITGYALLFHYNHVLLDFHFYVEDIFLLFTLYSLRLHQKSQFSSTSLISSNSFSSIGAVSYRKVLFINMPMISSKKGIIHSSLQEYYRTLTYWLGSLSLCNGMVLYITITSPSPFIDGQQSKINSIPFF